MFHYLRLKIGENLPDLSDLRPFAAIVVIDEKSDQAWQSKVSAWLVASGCHYALTWGEQCEAWHDAIDWASIDYFTMTQKSDFFVMTSWHAKEPLEDVFFFAKRCAVPVGQRAILENTVLLHLSKKDRGEEFRNCSQRPDQPNWLAF
ncbi:MAG: hypothetical protein AAF530_14160 [Pseudomonadota bacterium]